VAEPVRHGALTHVPRPSVGPLRWWHAGADGWPQLVVPYEHQPHAHYLFSAGTGKRLHLSSDLQDVRVADLDGDGVPELVSFRPDRADVFDRGGQLVAVRGRSPETWRRLGGYWQATADLDGDGIADLLSVPPPDLPVYEEKPRRRDAAARPRDPTDKPLTRVVSGADGRLLWQAEITDGKPTANWQTTRYERVVAGADLDGDGVADLLATGKLHCNYQTSMGLTFSPLVAVSGRTGRHLWAADFQVDLWNGPQLLECRDLDGDGRPEVLFVSASTWDWPPGPNDYRSSNDWRYWLAVLDGATGRVKWRQPLSERNSSNSNGGPAWTPFAFAVTDLQGDGSADLVVEAGLPENDGEVRAFRGRDGEPLWTWKPARRPLDKGSSKAGRPTLTVGDLGGRRAVVVLHTVTSADARGNNEPHAEVVALDARTGQPLWSWQRPVDWAYNDTSNGAVTSQAVPLLVQLGGGRRAVCVWTYNYDERSQVALLDEQGHLLRSIAVDFRLKEQDREQQRRQPQIRYSPVYGPHFRVWCHDLDGDGLDELVVLTNDHLQVLTGDLSQVRWEWQLPDASCDVIDVHPGGGRRPATLVVRAGHRVVGLSGGDGRLIWSCAGSGTPTAVLSAADTLEDQPGAAFSLPRVVFDLGDQATVCRRALPAGDLSSRKGFVPYTAPEKEDTRSTRPLPWNAVADLPPLVPASPWGIALALGGLSLAVAVVPAWLWWRALRGRHWRLALVSFVWLALVWAGVCLLYLALLNDDASFRVSQTGWWGFVRQIGKETLKVAPAGLPLVVFAVVAWRCLRRRQWVRLAALGLLAAALAGAAAWLWLGQAAPGLDDDQHFSRRGWSGIAPAGIYGAGLLLLIGWLLGVVYRLLRGVGRRLRPAPSP
jgi:outer membrane protein assembly factor BamB